MQRALAAVLISCLLALSGFQTPAFAWGAKGHHIINHLAIASLPPDLPAFMRSAAADYEVTYLGLELDLLKGAGDSWDAENDPGHYLDLIGDGTIEGGLRLNALPLTREAYDTALRARGTDQYKMGYLPYSIAQGWEQLRMVLAYWRVDHYESTHAHSAASRSIAAQRENVDRQLALRDAGVWGHYVADAAQPLHVTVHFNGWGKYPNPNGYSNSPHFHDLFETDYVDRYITMAGVAKDVAPFQRPLQAGLVSDARILNAVEAYLAASNATVPQLYAIAKAGGFSARTARGTAFEEQRLAFGASELRMLIAWAWQDSLNETIGDDAPQLVSDIVEGKVRYKGLP